MAGDTIIGLSSDALIGLAMPFTLISMGQVLLNMDEDVCVVESKSFKLDMAGMKITTPGGAVAFASKAEKAADLVKAAEKAEEAAKAAKAAKEAAEAFIKTSEEVEKLAAKLPDIEKLEKTADDARKAYSEARVAFKDAGKDSKKLETARTDLQEATKAFTDADKALKDGKQLEIVTNKAIADAINDGGKALTGDADKAYKAFETKDFVEAGKNAAAAKTEGSAAKFFKAGFSVTKDSHWAGSSMKTLLKGFDYAAALKAVGVDADKAAAAVKITKAAYKSITKGVSTGIRGQAGQDQSDNLKNDPDTKQVDGKEEKKPGT